MHTQNLKADARASLLVMQDGDGDPLGAARITLVGEALPVPEAETGAVRELYLSRNENARYWVDFDDFGFYRLQPADVYFIGGFGVMGWVPADEYRGQPARPAGGFRARNPAHMNQDHAEALVLWRARRGRRMRKPPA